jgi:uncharacterized protein (TIRG00374 family)
LSRKSARTGGIVNATAQFWRQNEIAPTVAWTIVTTLSSIAFLWMSLRGVNYAQLAAVIARSSLGWVFLAVIANLANLWFRAVRWQAILKTTKVIAIGEVFAATMIGFMANNLLPARAGELVKVFVLAHDHRLSKVTTVATVVLERLFDSVALVLIVLALILSGKSTGASWMRTGVIGGAALCVVALLALILMRRQSASLTAWLRWRLGPERSASYPRALGAVPAFAAGLDCLSREEPRTLALVAVTTALIWLTMLANVWCGVTALGLAVPFSASVVALIAQSFGMLIPSGPANLGVYQFTTVAAVALFGVSRTNALGLSLVLHASRFFPTTIVGLGYLVRLLRRRIGQLPAGGAVSPVGSHVN